MSETTITQPPVAIGATVYIPRAWGRCDIRVPCPVCYGQLYATLILGNGEHVNVECDGCGIGSLTGPTGFILGHEAQSRVETGTVTGFDWDGAGWQIRTGYEVFAWGDAVFATREEAEAKREVLYAAAVVEAAQRSDWQAGHHRKKVTWLVRYHRGELKRAERDVAHHSQKLSDALARQRKAKADAATPPTEERSES